jgi:flagellar hook-associated protein 1 FlgK
MSRATFFGFNIANSGLFVAQRNIDITSHNIANANTPGFTRQRMITANIPPPHYASKIRGNTTTLVGGGVKGLSIEQIRSVFLDRQYRARNTEAEYWNARGTALYYLEDIFNNTADTGLNKVISDFFDSISTLHAANVDNAAMRNIMVENARTMTTMINGYYERMEDLMYEQDHNIRNSIVRVNAVMENIASLNRSIFIFEQGGSNANDLRDQRNLLLDELAGYMDISYEEVSTGKRCILGRELTTMSVWLGPRGNNQWLVDGYDSRVIAAVQDHNNTVTQDIMPPVDPTRLLHTLRFADTLDADGRPIANTAPIDIRSGALKGYMDIRDGNSRENQGIPYFVNQLNILVKGIVESVNTVLLEGYTVPYTDANGIFHPSRKASDDPPIFFFDPTGNNAATFRLSEAVGGTNGSGFNIAASSIRITKGDPSILDDAQTGNNLILLELLTLRNRTDLPGIGGYTDFFNRFLSEMATEVGRSLRKGEEQMFLLDSIENQRLSYSGVSLDEEMVNLVRFQHAYNAAARMITAMDEALDVLINRTGRVGL